MDTVYIIGRLLAFAALLALPQFLGLLVHFRMRNYPRLVYFVGFAITMISSFSLLQIIFLPRSNNETCGLVTMAGMVFILFFMSIQLVVSLATQNWFHRKYRS